MSKKIWLAIVIAAILTGAGYGYYLYNKPRAAMADKAVDITTDAPALVAAFEKNEDAANKQYLDKVIAVKGTVTDQTNDANGVVITLKGDDNSSVNCALSTPPAKNIKGTNVVIKGRCTGFLLDVNLVDCILQ